jgi:hypothetical protein
VSIIALSASNQDTFLLNPWLKYGLAIPICILFGYGVYSVIAFFGIRRAVGIDHFESKASQVPFVKKGIFKYTPNGMYAIVFLIIYLPGILFDSAGGLLIGLFSHIYIWIHYYFTELPDIQYIYGKKFRK